MKLPRSHPHAYEERHVAPHFVTKSLIPVVMSGIIAVYGLVVSVLIAGGRESSWHT